MTTLINLEAKYLALGEEIQRLNAVGRDRILRAATWLSMRKTS